MIYTYECEWCGESWDDDTAIEDVCPFCDGGPDGIAVTPAEEDK